MSQVLYLFEARVSVSMFPYLVHQPGLFPFLCAALVPVQSITLDLDTVKL
jgi:hypothetical protein